MLGPESNSLILAIDQGGHASRALVFDLTGKQLAQAFHPVATRRIGADRVEHDPLEIVATTRQAIRDVCKSLGDDSSRLKFAGLATQRSSIVCWDRTHGAPLSPVLSWQDRRGAEQVNHLRDRRDFVHEGGTYEVGEFIRERTGLVLSPHYGASKMRWCLDHLPAVRAALTERRLAVAPLSSYLLYSLLKAHPWVVDPANASRTQLWDVNDADWSAPLCKLFGVPTSILPRNVPSRCAFGTLDPGLKGNLPIPCTVCTGDQSAALFAHGEIQPGTAYLNIGTGAFLQCLILDPQREVKPLLRSMAWWDSASDSRLVVMEGTVNGAGSAIDWADDRLSLDAHRVGRTLTATQVQSLNPAVFINGVSGAGSPYWLPQLESRWLEDGAAHSEFEKLVAVVESIAFLICANLEAMRGTGVKLQRLLASGGLSTCDYLCECVASIGRIEVARTTLQETTATGLAFLTAGEPTNWNPPAAVDLFESTGNESLQKRHASWLTVMNGAINSAAIHPAPDST